ncbi:MAG: methyltransferase domain-containing protein [Bacteroidetes bacterium]|nr:MAG: methyltransferase domain-containing protein [Bacteroidota bacterium]REK04771.1 MAG: methyltransferase domain-containing protein [Bacteroidota bacterium]REK36245.1 MAG: methyltransferase domain-containing protein [Bacteroidota bacterium]REK51093.1 MAG: methyltransferase domain-containing protein [Bacteroidota bacterium]
MRIISIAEKKLLDIFYKPLVLKYTSETRTYRYRHLKVDVHPGVFHPGLFYSTKTLLFYLEKKEIKSKRLLELGCGTGLISIYASSKGAFVTATDINPAAIMNAGINYNQNSTQINAGGGTIQILQSDLFNEVSDYKFDLIIVNPPYYRGKIKSERDYAWYAGENMEYFERFFSSVTHFLSGGSTCLMVLSDEVLESVNNIAGFYGVKLNEVFKRKVLLEINRVYELSANA